jgi:hypothetical protein
VRVVYADGAEEVGTAIDRTHVDVGPMGLQVKLREVVEIDGVPHTVIGFGPGSRSANGERSVAPGSEEPSVRLEVKPRRAERS